MLKVAFVGSREYTNKRKIKDMLFKLRQKYGNEVEIVSGGQPKGADGIAKKYALEFDMNYVEFPPAHYRWNQHCILEHTQYGKPYGVWHYSNRNKQLAEYCDIVLAFLPNGIVKGGTANTLKHAEKANKKILVFD